ncbi:hypothetical protein D3C78_1165050 [compost metagenome]
MASPVSIGLQLRLAGLGQWIKTQIHHFRELCGGLKQPVRQLADLVTPQIHHVQIGQAVQPQRELGGVSIAQPQRMQTEQFADIRRSTQPIVGERQHAQLRHVSQFAQRVFSQAYLITVQAQSLQVGHVRERFR